MLKWLSEGSRPLAVAIFFATLVRAWMFWYETYGAGACIAIGLPEPLASYSKSAGRIADPSNGHQNYDPLISAR
jgi:hypothetical protein